MFFSLQTESFMVSHRSCNLPGSRQISFSQKRFTGFRNFYEFEQKRVLVANQKQLKVLAYHPRDMAKGVRLITRQEDARNGQGCLPDPTEQNSALFCCGGAYSTTAASTQRSVGDYPNQTLQRESLAMKLSIKGQKESDLQSQHGPTQESTTANMPIQMINNDDLEDENNNFQLNSVR